MFTFFQAVVFFHFLLWMSCIGRLVGGRASVKEATEKKLINHVCKDINGAQNLAIEHERPIY